LVRNPWNFKGVGKNSTEKEKQREIASNGLMQGGVTVGSDGSWHLIESRKEKGGEQSEASTTGASQKK